MSDAYDLRWDDEACGRTLVRVSDGAEIAYDYGEPEDKSFGRDFAPVVEELNRLAAALARERERADRAEAALTSLLEHAPDPKWVLEHALDEEADPVSMIDNANREYRAAIIRARAALAGSEGGDAT